MKKALLSTVLGLLLLSAGTVLAGEAAAATSMMSNIPLPALPFPWA